MSGTYQADIAKKFNFKLNLSRLTGRKSSMFNSPTAGLLAWVVGRLLLVGGGLDGAADCGGDDLVAFWGAAVGGAALCADAALWVAVVLGAAALCWLDDEPLRDTGLWDGGCCTCTGFGMKSSSGAENTNASLKQNWPYFTAFFFTLMPILNTLLSWFGSTL